VEETLLPLVSGVFATGFFHGAGYLELRLRGESNSGNSRAAREAANTSYLSCFEEICTS